MMAAGANDTLPHVARPPRAMAWVVLLLAAAAVLSVGVVATVVLFGRLGAYPSVPGIRFWAALFGAGLLTVASLSLRSLRWIFLLRRAETRIPIRDAYIGYFSGFSVLFAPLLAGEVAVRALVHRSRGKVPVHTTIVVNVWERMLDAAALSMLAAVAGFVVDGRLSLWRWVLVGCAALSFVTPVRRVALTSIAAVTQPIARLFDVTPAPGLNRLAGLRTWTTALATSLVAWVLPCAGLWLLAAAAERGLALVDAIATYSGSATDSALSLAPGGVLVAGRQMLTALAEHGFTDADAVLAVFGVRLSTVGVSVALGVLFVIMHVRTVSASSATHFDDIAEAYDVQIPESRRHALLLRKTELMKAVVDARGVGRRGLDVGCGQGAYVGRMRELGFTVDGIDMSAGQVRLAGQHVADARVDILVRLEPVGVVRLGQELAVRHREHPDELGGLHGGDAAVAVQPHDAVRVE